MGCHVAAEATDVPVSPLQSSPNRYVKLLSRSKNTYVVPTWVCGGVYTWHRQSTLQIILDSSSSLKSSHWIKRGYFLPVYHARETT